MIVGEEEILIKDLYYVLMKAHFGNVKTCKTMIKHGHVNVNKELITDVYFQVDKDDDIRIDKQKVEWPFVYYMLNKPKNYLSATYDKNEHYVLELINNKDCFCLGRLDKDTTGLLILTNDVSYQALLLPQNHINKKYLVKVDRSLNDELIKEFEQGIIIDFHYKCHSAKLEIIDDRSCFVTIDEGKYHQIKKMFLSCGYYVVDLKRVGFGDIVLDSSLKEGEVKELNDKEFQILKKYLNDIKRGI